MGRGGWGVTFALNYNSQMWRQFNGVDWKFGRDVGYGYGWACHGRGRCCRFTDSSGAEYRLDVNTGGVWTSKEVGAYWRAACCAAEREEGEAWEDAGRPASSRVRVPRSDGTA